MDSIPGRRSFDSQVPSSRSSLSCPSEPPDVGNWFSSYEYRSPSPHSDFSFEDSVFGGRQSERGEEKEREEANFEKIRTAEEAAAAGDKQVESSSTCVEQDNLSLTQNPDSFSSGALLSEPPDIRNWFSSYVYESPVFDTNSIFKDVASEEDDCKDEKFDCEVKNEDGSDNIHPKVCVKHNNSSYDKNMRAEQPSSRPRMQEAKVQHNLGPANSKYEETLSMNYGSSGCSRAAHLMSLDINRNSDYNSMRPPELVHKNDIREVESKAKIQNNKLDMSASSAKGFSARSSTCTINKENVGDMKSMDGFVTARKNKCTGENDENSWKKPKELLVQCSTNNGTASLACEKQAITKRKALTEATNLQQSNALEITGKWQCPQKRKPNLGPALKQLRLERWVHRV